MSFECRGVASEFSALEFNSKESEMLNMQRDDESAVGGQTQLLLKVDITVEC